MEKVVKSMKFKINSRFRVCLINIDSVTDYSIYWHSDYKPSINEEIILTMEERRELAQKVLSGKEIFYGLINPKEKKFDAKKWTLNHIENELAHFSRVVKIVHWGGEVFFMLDRRKKTPEKYFKIAFNWKE